MKFLSFRCMISMDFRHLKKEVRTAGISNTMQALVLFEILTFALKSQAFYEIRIEDLSLSPPFFGLYIFCFGSFVFEVHLIEQNKLSHTTQLGLERNIASLLIHFQSYIDWPASEIRRYRFRMKKSRWNWGMLCLGSGFGFLPHLFRTFFGAGETNLLIPLSSDSCLNKCLTFATIF